MSDDPVDNAWKIHAALVDWTGKVDTKASFALTIEAALLAGVVTLSGSDRVFDKLSGWFPVTLYVLGIVVLVASVLSAVWVVRPRLRAPNLKAEAASSYIYFGHLRLLDDDAVVNHLNNTPIAPVLARQLVQMSKIAWNKHVFVQWSMTLAVVGVILLGLCAGAATTSP
ncbi:Pycsar system effector family protein [Mycolicibacterium wolinskyi]|uniref:Pycsar system effector family protein n=1 Tax=Mycolicibacterium wolinskyi TaxID=59750 RepID=UPI0039177889